MAAMDFRAFSLMVSVLTPISCMATDVEMRGDVPKPGWVSVRPTFPQKQKALEECQQLIDQYRKIPSQLKDELESVSKDALLSFRDDIYTWMDGEILSPQRFEEDLFHSANSSFNNSSSPKYSSGQSSDELIVPQESDYLFLTPGGTMLTPEAAAEYRARGGALSSSDSGDSEPSVNPSWPPLKFVDHELDTMFDPVSSQSTTEESRSSDGLSSSLDESGSDDDPVNLQGSKHFPGLYFTPDPLQEGRSSESSELSTVSSWKPSGIGVQFRPVVWEEFQKLDSDSSSLSDDEGGNTSSPEPIDTHFGVFDMDVSTHARESEELPALSYSFTGDDSSSVSLQSESSMEWDEALEEKYRLWQLDQIDKILNLKMKSLEEFSSDSITVEVIRHVLANYYDFNLENQQDMSVSMVRAIQAQESGFLEKIQATNPGLDSRFALGFLRGMWSDSDFWQDVNLTQSDFFIPLYTELLDELKAELPSSFDADYDTFVVGNSLSYFADPKEWMDTADAKIRRLFSSFQWKRAIVGMAVVAAYRNGME